MSRVITSSGSVTATGVIATLDVSDCEPSYTVGVAGTFVGSVVVELSYDGTNWHVYGSALTAPGTVEVTAPAKMVRARCSAFTSGTIAAGVSKLQK